jgi:hypothetical protein
MTKTKKLTRMTTILKDWKIREVLDILHVAYSKVYNPSEHMAIDAVTVLFQRKGAFWQCIPKKHKCLGIKIYRLCDTYG